MPITLFIRVDEPPLYPTGVVLDYVWDQIRASPMVGQTIFWERAYQNPVPIARPPPPPMQSSVENVWGSAPYPRKRQKNKPEGEDPMEGSIDVEETDTEEEDDEVQSAMHGSRRPRVRRSESLFIMAFYFILFRFNFRLSRIGYG